MAMIIIVCIMQKMNFYEGNVMSMASNLSGVLPKEGYHNSVD
jgi:hypothetical protein